MVTTKRFETRDLLEAALTDSIAALLRAGIVERGTAALVVSGGRTPAGLFQRLSHQDLDWSKVVVTLADERWVPADHADSNARSVETHLLQYNAKRAQFIPQVNAAATPFEGQAELETLLQQRLPAQIDAVILGMGEDGHTASFFPNAPELSAAIDPQTTQACLAVTPPVAPHLRMTLTLPRLLASKQIFLHLCGEGKTPVLDAAMGEGPAEEMPVRTILRQADTPVDIYWAP